MTRVIRGRQTEQGAVVTIDDQVLPLPALDPRLEARHAGHFTWGYGGNGPAELARAILVALAPDDPIVRHPRCYQQFKWDVIARLEGPAFELLSEGVDGWYTAWKREAPGVGLLREFRRRSQCVDCGRAIALTVKVVLEGGDRCEACAKPEAVRS